MTNVLFPLLLLLLVSGEASGQLYKWVDAKGEVHFTTTPPPESAKDVQVRQPAAEEPARPAKVPTAAPSATPAGKPSSPKGAFLNRLYTASSIETERARFEKSVKYYREECSAIQQRSTKGRTPEFWDEYCEDAAMRQQRGLDVLSSDPDRYFYTTDWIKRKAMGERVDVPPLYPPWN